MKKLFLKEKNNLLEKKLITSDNTVYLTIPNVKINNVLCVIRRI